MDPHIERINHSANAVESPEGREKRSVFARSEKESLGIDYMRHSPPPVVCSLFLGECVEVDPPHL
jgi:hypothetical protein